LANALAYNELLRDFAKNAVFGIIISLLSGYFTKTIIWSADEKRRRKLHAPLRALALDAIVSSHGKLFENLENFGTRDYRRQNTRINHLKNAFGSTFLELKTRTIGTSIDLFTDKEKEKLFAYIDSGRLEGVSPLVNSTGVRTNIESVNERFARFKESLPAEERQILHDAIWTPQMLDDLNQSVFSRFDNNSGSGK